MFQPRAFHQLYVHLIWCVKNRDPLLDIKWRIKLFQHIKTNAEIDHEIHVDFINGVEDHVHCIIFLRPTQSVSNCAKALKGLSSRCINTSDFFEGKFSWQTGYGAFTFSKSELRKVREYIKNQEAHHRSNSLNDELKEFGMDPKNFY